MARTHLLTTELRLALALPMLAALGCTPLARGFADAAADGATDALTDAVASDRPDAAALDVADAPPMDRPDVVAPDAPPMDAPPTDRPDVVASDIVDVPLLDRPDMVAPDIVDVAVLDRPDVVDVPVLDRPDVVAPDIVDVPGTDVVDAGSCTTSAAAKLLRPPSGARVTGRMVTFRWTLPPSADGARLELCSNRSCSPVSSSVNASGSSHTMMVPGRTWWRVQPTRLGVSCGALSATWSLISDTNNGPGMPYRVLTDLNGDLITDALVSGLNAGGGAGRLYVFTGASGMGIPPEPSQTIAPPVGGGGRFGAPVAGDFNGDGFTDVAVSQENSSNMYLGRVWTLLSNGSQLGVAQELTPPSPVYSHFGTSMFSGDFNGDGYADLAVASGMLDAGSSDVDDPQGGRLTIYRGSQSGLGATPIETFISTGGAGSQFGNGGSVVDLNNDGLDDLLINLFSGAGRVWVHFRGRNAGMELVPNRISALVGTNFEDSTPSNLGDVTGDGHVDVGAIFGSGTNWGMLVASGASDTLGSSGFTVSLNDAPQGVQHLGSADVSGDGVSDLIVTQSRMGTSRVYVYRSTRSAASFLTQINALTGQPEFDGPITIGDYNGDGFWDVLAGHPTHNGGQGAISMVPGVFGGFSSMPMGRALLAPENSALMGSRLASILRLGRSREL